VPSNLVIKGTRVLLTYEGQPLTCYNCGEVGHMYNVCPHRRPTRRNVGAFAASTYASVASGTRGPEVADGLDGPATVQAIPQTRTELVAEKEDGHGRWSDEVESVMTWAEEAADRPGSTGYAQPN
jgi:hypothetical protein